MLFKNVFQFLEVLKCSIQFKNGLAKINYNQPTVCNFQENKLKIKNYIDFSNVSTPSNLDKSFKFWMQHFLPDQQNPNQEIDSNQIQLFSLNVCTLTIQKLQIIIDFLKDKNNQIQILTEININSEKFEKMKKHLNQKINQSISTKVLNHVNGGLIVLWDNKLKIQPSPSHRQFTDQRTIYLEFKPNPNFKILILACYLPTVDLHEWQNIPNIDPDISINEIRNQSERKEYLQYQNKIAEVTSRDFSDYEHMIIIGDMNMHYISTHQDHEQVKYIIQKDHFDSMLNERSLSLNSFDDENEFNQTQFKGDKNSILDYVFTTNLLRNYVSKTKIWNDSLIPTDHNIISINLNLEVLETLNKPNINRKTFVNTSLLTTDEGVQSYVSSLSQFDITEANFKDILLQIKQPLVQICPDKIKFQVNDETTKTLRKMKKLFMRIRRQDLASQTTKRMKKYVNQIRRLKTKKRIDTIVNNQKTNLRDWWKLTTRQVKPKSQNITYSVNEEGFNDINTTLNNFKNQFKNLQQRKVFVDEIENMEDWVACFFVKQQPSDTFKYYAEFVEQKVNTDQQIDQDSLEIFMGVRNEESNLDQGQADIILSKEHSKTSVRGQYFKPFEGLRVQPEELNTIIKDMKNFKAPGFDNVDARILKNLPESYIKRFVELQNNMFDHSQVDDNLKQVIVTLLSKNTNPNPTPDDFRPISLLSVPCFKLIEKLILARILLSTNMFQFGFKKYNSTADMLKVLNEILESCKQRYPNGVGLFSLGMYDYRKAFNSVQFLKLIAKLDSRGVDKNILALLLNLQMPQKVQFKIGDNVSTEPISLNLQCGHQGSCFMPQAFVEQVSDFVNEVEIRESNMIQAQVADQIYYSNQIMFADDQNEADYFAKSTRISLIGNTLRTNLDHFKEKSRLAHLSIADNKCKHLTNDIDKLRNAVSNWSNFEVTNHAKLVGVRFKLKKNLDLCYKDQFEYIKDKVISSFEKLKIAQGINKFLTSKQGINMAKAFCIPVIDYNNVNIYFTESQILKLDSITYRSIKHMLGFRYTSLSMNFQVCFNILKYSDRRNICKFFFLIKHYDTSIIHLNACTNVLQGKQSIEERNQQLYQCLWDLDLSGIKEHFIEIGYLEPSNDFDASDMYLIEFLDKLHRKTKNGIHKALIHAELKTWVKKLFKLRTVLDQLNQEGSQTMLEMRTTLYRWRIDSIHLNQFEGANLLKNHTAWQVMLQWDFDSRLNSFELNNVERKFEKRILKLFFCSQRLAYRIRVITTNQGSGEVLTWGTCNICGQGEIEDESHFLRECTAYNDIKAYTYNIILPLTNHRLDYSTFINVLDLQLQGSYEMMRRAFGDIPENEFHDGFMDQTVKTHRLFNKELKIMVIKMLDRRKDKMIEINFEDRVDLPEENRERQKQYCELQKWKY